MARHVWLLHRLLARSRLYQIYPRLLFYHPLKVIKTANEFPGCQRRNVTTRQLTSVPGYPRFSSAKMVEPDIYCETRFIEDASGSSAIKQPKIPLSIGFPLYNLCYIVA